MAQQHGTDVDPGTVPEPDQTPDRTADADQAPDRHPHHERSGGADGVVPSGDGGEPVGGEPTDAEPTDGAPVGGEPSGGPMGGRSVDGRPEVGVGAAPREQRDDHAARAGTDPEPVPAVEPGPNPEPAMGQGPVAQVGPGTKLNTESESGSEPKANPEANANPEPEAEPEPVTGPEPDPEPTAAPEPEPVEVAVPDLSGLGADFVWGAASSAFQIEGDAEGRGRSIWDDLCDVPGAITDSSDGRTACDHVHRYAEDIRLMRELGVDAYRFSIAWPRVMPDGTGPLSRAGLDFYDRLVDGLLEAGIDPWVTLYHWDLPSRLQQDLGGWASRDLVRRFTDYAVAVHAALGDRVRHWATLNEPWCSAWLGYGSGLHAPGIRDHTLAARASHHLLLAHGEAVRAIRDQAPADHELGIVLNLFPIRPATHLHPVVAEHVGEVTRLMDGVQNRWWLDALFEGHYPQDVIDRLGPRLAGVVRDGDLEVIGTPLDFLGVNYYSDQFCVPAARPTPDDEGAYPFAGLVRGLDPGAEGTTMGWPVTPDGLREILVRIGLAYPAAPPLVVTENGAAYDDDPRAVLAAPVGSGRPVEDPPRVRYLRAHLEAVARAAREGADVRGYFYWTLMDNFEWSHGYTQRFGLLRVDFDTLDRVPRRSYHLYRDAIAAQRAADVVLPD